MSKSKRCSFLRIKNASEKAVISLPTVLLDKRIAVKGLLLIEFIQSSSTLGSSCGVGVGKSVFPTGGNQLGV